MVFSRGHTVIYLMCVHLLSNWNEMPFFSFSFFIALVIRIVKIFYNGEFL